MSTTLPRHLANYIACPAALAVAPVTKERLRPHLTAAAAARSDRIATISPCRYSPPAPISRDVRNF
ncbi:hypothetical protein SS05631_b59610 (plasmid) [Sinorhizobium sp. CCBAU 05631]|nr:hypothetical protein SS05631_b59610 [Sinorhizobium sp. CCBAU 05631]